MMPDLRRLFPTRRLWAGRGATIRGYGDKRTLVGIQVNGAGDVLTLGRTDKSGVTPSLGTDKEPVSLRAGPGVRLHGYGGIHTLERLPSLVEEQTPTPGPARLEWDVEMYLGRAQICSLGFSVETPGHWLIADSDTHNFEFGSFVNTRTASGVITGYGSGETPPACADIVNESTENPDFDYGEPIDIVYAETATVAFADIIGAAIAAVPAYGGTTHSTASSFWQWNYKDWRGASEDLATHVRVLGTVGATTDLSASRVRFRFRNAGDGKLRVDYGFFGSGLPGGASDDPREVVIEAGAATDWIESPTIAPDPDKYRTAEIRRVRIGRWVSLS